MSQISNLMTALAPFLIPAINEASFAQAVEEALKPDYPTTKTFDLVSPIVDQGEPVNSITLREPTAGEMEIIEKSPRPGIDGISIIGKVPVKIAESLCARDYNAMRAYLCLLYTSPSPRD